MLALDHQDRTREADSHRKSRRLHVLMPGEALSEAHRHPTALHGAVGSWYCIPRVRGII